MEVVFDNKPKKRGWYIIYYSWTECKPAIPTVDHWNGEVWDSGLPVICVVDKRFKRKEKACTYYTKNEKMLESEKF